MSEWKDRVADLKDDWNRAKEQARTFGPSLPDGAYIAQLTTVSISESKSSERLQVAWEYVVVEGESVGTLIRDYDGLETEQNLTWLMRKLDRLGYDPTELDAGDLEAVMEELVARKPVLRVRLRTKGDYQNCYIDRVLDAGDLMQSPTSTGVAVEDAIEPANEPQEAPKRKSPEKSSAEPKAKPKAKPKVVEEEEFEVEDELEEELEELEELEDEEFEEDEEEEPYVYEAGVMVAWQDKNRAVHGEVVSVDDDGVATVRKLATGKLVHVHTGNLIPLEA
jgi:hypothetical protein